MSSDDPSGERLTALEVKAAYFEKMASDLDAVVRELSSEVTLLRREVERLRGRSPTRDTEELLDPDERPPHY